MDFGIATYPVLIGLTYIVGMVVKASKLDDKWIPVICALAGCVLGVVAMFIIPDFPGQDYLTAAAIGGMSGLAAVGVNQIGKQLTNKTEGAE